jgi:hypothetical protein
MTGDKKLISRGHMLYSCSSHSQNDEIVEMEIRLVHAQGQRRGSWGMTKGSRGREWWYWDSSVFDCNGGHTTLHL